MAKKQKILLVKKALDLIRPYLQKDGGDIAIVDLCENNDLKFKYLGNCKDCKFKDQTKFIIEKHIRKYFPELNNLIEVED